MSKTFKITKEAKKPNKKNHPKQRKSRTNLYKDPDRQKKAK